MAHVGHKVDYLAGFCCPVGGLAAGKPRVLCHENEIYLSNGSEFVYVYDQEGKVLQAIYRFPDQVWHVELLPLHRKLYILCAGTGIYCVSLDQQSRLMKQTDGDGKEDACPSSVFPVDSDACIVPDVTLCTFTLLNDVLVTLSQAQGQWWMKLHVLLDPDQESQPCRQISQVGFSTCDQTGDDGDALSSHFLPVLCCASAPGTAGPGESLWCSGGFTLEEPLFSLLFGIDAAMLDSPMILCGFPDGQLCCVPLKALSSSGAVDACSEVAGQAPPVKILHHLEEPVVFIGALRTEHKAPDDPGDEQLFGDSGCDCVVVVGHYGKMVAMKAERGEEAKVPEVREYYLQGPILCAACGGGSRMYYSTHSDISAVDLDWVSNASDPESIDNTAYVLPPVLSPASLSICSVVALSLSSRASEGDSELLALSAKGRLMSCDLCSPDDAHPVRLTPEKAGQRIKELLSGIGNVSERVSFLKKAVDQKNRALTSLNQVMNVSAALLSNQDGRKPVTCTVTASWSRLLLRDTWTISCVLENLSECSLEQGWTLCVQLFTSSCAFDEDSADSATTFTFPIDQLLPGSKREVTLPLGTAEGTKLELPLTVSCALFYSLREILDSASDSYESLDDLLPDDSPGLSPDKEGICLPLSKCTIDILQCLRLDDSTVPGAPPSIATLSDPVETFLKVSRVQSDPSSVEVSDQLLPKAPDALGDEYLPPSVASIKVSSELLKNALKSVCEGAPLCCAALQWLLAENAAAAALRSQDVSAVRGLAPRGGEVQLLVREVVGWARAAWLGESSPSSAAVPFTVTSLEVFLVQMSDGRGGARNGCPMLLPLEHRYLWLLGSTSNPPPSTAMMYGRGGTPGVCPALCTDNPCGLAMFAVRISSLLQVAVNDLCPAGPIQAVEILIQSPSLADMCRVHQAVIRRIQTLVLEQAAQGSSPPDLRMQYLCQIQANHEMLLKDVQSLRDRLCLGDDASATAEKLLHVYRQLRNPSLILL
ncbi:Fanconi anemia core complex-associated protein 100 isoform X3 [Mauremys mutica]|nr:Fanconi anemia core complex-associated protein 100 isoform X3 [Mauremys mutica]